MESAHAHDFESFRAAARTLLMRHRPPHEVSWRDPKAAQTSLFSQAAEELAPSVEGPSSALRVPPRYVELASLAVLYRSADRFDLAYRVLYRLTHGEPRLLGDLLDPAVLELARRAQSVRHDEHRAHAFVRFRRTEHDGQERYLAWYEPEHYVLRLAAPFFARRFAVQRWAIMTPDESAFWDGAELSYGPAVEPAQLPKDQPGEEELERLFRTYYGATFNPARRNPQLFVRHVPRAFQRNLPELVDLPELFARMPVAPRDERTEALQRTGASSLEVLASELCGCRACPLGEQQTRAVAGEGPYDAKLCLIGEQPGDEEEVVGRPFVGPAGRVLDRALHEAGIVRERVYMTNAVKHFGFRPVGKKRLHQTPRWENVSACKPWLTRELMLLSPHIVVCLGATAAQALFGRRFSVSINRGRLFRTTQVPHVIVSYHPSAVLRAADAKHADELYAALVEDLRRAGSLLSADG